MAEAGTTVSDPPQGTWIRVVASAIRGLRLPFLDATGRRDAIPVDMPALAMATVAAPAAIAVAFRGVEGLVLGGPAAAVSFAAAGSLMTLTMASLAVLVLWGVEAALGMSRLRPETLMPRAYSYALAFLATTGLPGNGISTLCLLAFGALVILGFVRRSGAGPTGGDRLLLPAAFGYLAFHFGMTFFFAAGGPRGMIALVNATLESLL